MDTMMAQAPNVPTPIDIANAQHRRMFIASIVIAIVVAVIAAIATAVMTYLVWDSGNKVQAAVQADADARIATANATAETGKRDAEIAKKDAAHANAGLAKSNQEIARLNAETAQTKLKLEEEATKRAEAERRLLEVQNQIQQRVAPRRVAADQRATLLASLRQMPGRLRVVRLGEEEASRFADELVAVIREAGWIVDVTDGGSMSPPIYGLAYFATAAGIPGPTASLLEAIRRAGFPVATDRAFGPISGLLVGLRPTPPPR